MKPGWMASAGILFTLLTAVEGWPALRELAAHREWRVVKAPSGHASMDGLQLAVQTQVAAVAAQRPERAAVLIRLQMQVTPAARATWRDCSVSLHGAAGQTWRPLTSASSDGAIKALSPDGKNKGLCRLHERDEGAEAVTTYADQLFLLPSDALQGLRLNVSGAGTRPRALSFDISPMLRQLP